MIARFLCPSPHLDDPSVARHAYVIHVCILWSSNFEPRPDEPLLVSGQDEFARLDEAFSDKLSSRACPVCGRGQFEPLHAEFVVRPTGTTEVEPVEAVAQVCVRCGFLALHASKYLLEKESH